jgi:hypothetical protein
MGVVPDPRPLNFDQSISIALSCQGARNSKCVDFFWVWINAMAVIIIKLLLVLCDSKPCLLMEKVYSFFVVYN